MNVEAWNQWCAERSPAVRELAEKVAPWLRYRIKATGQIGHIYSFRESDEGPPTITLRLPAAWNPVSIQSLTLGDYGVFGLSLDDIEALPEETPS